MHLALRLAPPAWLQTISAVVGQGLWNWTEAHQTSLTLHHKTPSEVKDFKLLPVLLQRWKFHHLQSTSWSNQEIVFTASLEWRDWTFLVLELMRLFWPNPTRDWINFTGSKESPITTKIQAQQFRQPHTSCSASALFAWSVRSWSSGYARL